MPKIFEYLGILVFKDFLEVYADKIVEKWIDYFVYHKDVEFEKINRRIK